MIKIYSRKNRYKINHATPAIATISKTEVIIELGNNLSTVKSFTIPSIAILSAMIDIIAPINLETSFTLGIIS